MDSHDDIEKRKNKIKDYIADGQIKKALKELIRFYNDFSKDEDDCNEVILLSSRYNRHTSAHQVGTLTFDTWDSQVNKIALSILKYTNSLYKEILDL